MSGPVARAAFAVCFLFLGAALASGPACATSRDVRDVIRISGYGVLGGTLLGLTAYPMTGKVKSIFLGSSVGLYVGLAIGVIYALESDHEPAPWQETRQEPFEGSALQAAYGPPALLEFRAPVLRF